MRKWYLGLSLLFLSIINFAQSVEITIKQDGNLITPVDGIYHLKKKEFAFVVHSKKIEGFLLGATFDGELYKKAIAKKLNKNVEWFQNTGMAEELYNKEKDITVNDEAPSYWYYTDKNDHRFDKTPKGNSNDWTATRTITNIFDTSSGSPVEIKNLDQNIYILFYEPLYNEDYDLIEKKTVFQGALQFDL